MSGSGHIPRWPWSLIPVLTVVGWISGALLLAAALLALVPVHNGSIQDCGVPAVALATARQDRIVDSAFEAAAVRQAYGIGFDEATPAQVRRAVKLASEQSCRERVGARMVPAGLLGLGGLLLGVAGLIGIWATRRTQHRIRLRVEEPGSSAPPPPPSPARPPS